MSRLFRSCPGRDAAVSPHNRLAVDVAVADGVQHFVTDEFVGIAQALFVDDSFVVKDDGVLQ